MRLPNRILRCLTASLLLLLSAGAVMADGYEDAQAGIAALNAGNNEEAIMRLATATDSAGVPV